MTPKRNRTSLASAGLKTALSLGVVTLVGCQSFNPNPTAPAAGGAKPPATGTQTPIQPSGTTPAAKPPVKLTPPIKGKAAIAGKAMAGAKIKVVDAATGKAVSGLIAAGGGNLIAAGGGNYALAQADVGDLVTGPDGGFDFQFPVSDNTFKVIIEGENGQSLSNIVDIDIKENGEPAFEALGNDDSNTGDGFNMDMSPATTLAADSVESMLNMAGGLKGDAEDNLIANLMEKGDTFTEQILVTMTPEREAEIATEFGKNEEGGLPTAFLQETLTEVGLGDEFGDVAKDFFQEFSELRAVPENIDTVIEIPLAEKDFGLIETFTDIEVNFTDADSFSVSGEGINFAFEVPDIIAEGPTVPPENPGDGPLGPDITPDGPGPGPDPVVDPVPVDDPIVDIPVDDGGVTDDPLSLPLVEGVFRNSDIDGTFFSPNMTITASTSSLSFSFSQNSGEDDVREIVARFPKNKVSINAPGGSWDADEVLASGTTDRGDSVNNIAMVKYSAFTADGITAAIDGATYSAAADDAVFTGYWMNNSTELAKVVVYDNGTDVLLAITYTHDSVNDAATIQNFGHDTTLTTVNNVIQLSGAARADTLLTSRTNFTSERFDDLAP